VDQVREELEAARVAIVSLLAVISDEQFRSVETALEALATMSDTVSPALEQLRLARAQQCGTDGREQAVRLAIEARLANT
jgi:DNA-binding transcriptional regulator/RsmH inhibitor MraZ